ncbi:exonuclease 1 [Anaeramoeba flamelloides]|uniref:Exonuclease 1 n=1 Tax=Anaeramoeba flamelloides TaxID=1746091 RepID=A0ABQ8XRM8_9EUKA|nr:exonuclease 1 [Anaeramoeba flamelloides]
MGIGGLLPVLNSISKRIHLSKFKGKKIAIDGYVILHRGSGNCSRQLVLEEPAPALITYCMNFISQLQKYGIIPIVVFDGSDLSIKSNTNEKRKKQRKKYKEEALAFLQRGDFEKAKKKFRGAVEITFEIAQGFVLALKEKGIEIIVAPYEADPQLAYLSRIGYCDGVYSVDSDLVVFGSRVFLHRYDASSGFVEQILYEDIWKVGGLETKEKTNNQTEKNNSTYSYKNRRSNSRSRSRRNTSAGYDFRDWDYYKFVQMCILSGCDYLDSIKGIGLKKAYTLLTKYETIEKVFQMLRYDPKLNVPFNYEHNFKKSFLTFLHQIVYDPIQEKHVHFRKYDESLTLDENVGQNQQNYEYLGKIIKPEIAKGIANGILNPSTFVRFDLEKIYRLMGSYGTELKKKYNKNNKGINQNSYNNNNKKQHNYANNYQQDQKISNFFTILDPQEEIKKTNNFSQMKNNIRNDNNNNNNNNDNDDDDNDNNVKIKKINNFVSINNQKKKKIIYVSPYFNTDTQNNSNENFSFFDIGNEEPKIKKIDFNSFINKHKQNENTNKNEQGDINNNNNNKEFENENLNIKQKKIKNYKNFSPKKSDFNFLNNIEKRFSSMKPTQKNSFLNNSIGLDNKNKQKKIKKISSPLIKKKKKKLTTFSKFTTPVTSPYLSRSHSYSQPSSKMKPSSRSSPTPTPTPLSSISSSPSSSNIPNSSLSAPTSLKSKKKSRIIQSNIIFPNLKQNLFETKNNYNNNNNNNNNNNKNKNKNKNNKEITKSKNLKSRFASINKKKSADKFFLQNDQNKIFAKKKSNNNILKNNNFNTPITNTKKKARRLNTGNSFETKFNSPQLILRNEPNKKFSLSFQNTNHINQNGNNEENLFNRSPSNNNLPQKNKKFSNNGLSKNSHLTTTTERKRKSFSGLDFLKQFEFNPQKDN